MKDFALVTRKLSCPGLVENANGHGKCAAALLVQVGRMWNLIEDRITDFRALFNTRVRFTLQPYMMMKADMNE